MILVLGSYDPKTEKILSKLKDDIPRRLMTQNDNILVFLLRDIDIYLVDYTEESKAKKVTLIAEKYADKTTILTLNEENILNSEDAAADSSSVDQQVANYATTKYSEAKINKLPILEKLRQLAGGVSLTLLIREEELTRGGEYIELAFLLGSATLQPSKVFFLKREGFDLSEMGWEILAYYGVNFRPYKDEQSLCKETTRLIKYFITKHQ